MEATLQAINLLDKFVQQAYDQTGPFRFASDTEASIARRILNRAKQQLVVYLEFSLTSQEFYARPPSEVGPAQSFRC